MHAILSLLYMFRRSRLQKSTSNPKTVFTSILSLS